MYVQLLRRFLLPSLIRILSHSHVDVGCFSDQNDKRTLANIYNQGVQGSWNVASWYVFALYSRLVHRRRPITFSTASPRTWLPVTNTRAWRSEANAVRLRFVLLPFPRPSSL
jgi:hypothetical protein